MGTSLKSQIRQTDISCTFRRLMKIYDEESLRFLVKRRLICHSGSQFEICTGNCRGHFVLPHYNYKRNHGDTHCTILYSPSPGNGSVRVLIIWRQIVRFTVTRVHERASKGDCRPFSDLSSQSLPRMHCCTVLCYSGFVREVTKTTGFTRSLLDWSGKFHATPLPFSYTVHSPQLNGEYHVPGWLIPPPSSFWPLWRAHGT